MPRRNPHWYSLNGSREYPLDETASQRPDAGDRLPSDLLVDLRLRWPGHLGRYAFLSAASVTPYGLSLTFQATDDWENLAADCTPLAAVTVLRSDLQVGRAYGLLAQADGVHGYVVFGHGAERDYAARFSAPRQAWLAPRAARPYDLPLVTSLRRRGVATPLTGLVLLKGEDPVEVVRESREIGGVVRDCIVIRLVEDPDAATSVFETYAGPCAGRAESGNCPDPQPIQSINSVGPDCDGMVELVFQGCATVGQVVDDEDQDLGGIVLDCGMSVTDACRPPYLPDDEGRLPLEWDEYYVSDTGESVPEEDLTPSDEVVTVNDMPYTECFTDGVATNFAVKAGQFDFEEDPTRPACADDESQGFPEYTYATLLHTEPCLSVWEGFDITTLFRFVTVDLQPVETTSGSVSGGVVYNYRPHSVVPGRFTYFYVGLEADRLALYRYDGYGYKLLGEVAVAPAYGTWYQLSVSTDVVDGQVLLTAEITDGASLYGVIPWTVLAEFMPDNGLLGVGSLNGKARFAKFAVEIYDPP